MRSGAPCLVWTCSGIFLIFYFWSGLVLVLRLQCLPVSEITHGAEDHIHSNGCPSGWEKKQRYICASAVVCEWCWWLKSGAGGRNGSTCGTRRHSNAHMAIQLGILLTCNLELINQNIYYIIINLIQNEDIGEEFVETTCNNDQNNKLKNKVMSIWTNKCYESCKQTL